MTQYYHNNVLLSSTSFLNYQSAPESTIYGFSHATNPVNPLFHVENYQEAGAQMETNKTDSWLLSNPCYSQIDGPFNLASYCSWYESYDHGQVIDQLMQTRFSGKFQ